MNGANLWHDVAQRLLESTGINREVETALLAWVFGLRLLQRRGRLRPLLLSGRLYYDPAMDRGMLRAFVVRVIAARALEQSNIAVSEAAVRGIAKALSKGSLALSGEIEIDDEIIGEFELPAALSSIQTSSSA